MWHKEYRDYKTDESLIKNKLSSGKGIVGCEMHEINGWGEHHHIPQKKRKNLFAKLLSYFFGTEKDS
jgi:hypothetical protein